MVPVIIRGVRRGKSLLREPLRERRVARQHRHRGGVDGGVGISADGVRMTVVLDGSRPMFACARARPVACRSESFLGDPACQTPHFDRERTVAKRFAVDLRQRLLRFVDSAHARRCQRAKVEDLGRCRVAGRRVARQVERLQIEAAVERSANRRCHVNQRPVSAPGRSFWMGRFGACNGDAPNCNRPAYLRRLFCSSAMRPRQSPTYFSPFISAGSLSTSAVASASCAAGSPTPASAAT